MTTTLLIPGLLCDGFVWQPLLQELDGEALVAYLTTRDDVTDMANDCLAMADGRLRVAGHSMGARVVMEMARLAPQRMERLILLDTGIHPLKEGELDKRQDSVRIANQGGLEALAGPWLEGMVYEPNQSDALLMKGLTEMVLRQDPQIHERQIRALINRPDASAYLGTITCPVLLVVGRHDAWAPVSQHEDMLALLPDARLEIIENAGHFAPVEAPEICTKLCAEFLMG